MSALQNTVFWIVGDPFSHKTAQPQKGYNTIEAYKYFSKWNHIFDKYGKFILIEQYKNTSTEALKQKAEI